MAETSGRPAETQEDRDAAYKELRKQIARQLRLHGVPAILIAFTDRETEGTGRSFINHRRGEVFQVGRTHVQLEQPHLTLSKSRIDEADTMHETQYIAVGREPFKRNDFTGHVLDSDPTPQERAEHEIKMAEHITANFDAVEAGLTSQPITAEEALDLADLVAGGEPLPDPLGRAPRPWHI